MSYSDITKEHLSGLWRLLPASAMHAVTLLPAKGSGGYSAGIAVAQARRKPGTNSVPGGGAVVIREERVVWGLWTATATGYVSSDQTTWINPRPGDRIADDNGVNWFVERVEKKAFGEMFDCTTRREL